MSAPAPVWPYPSGRSLFQRIRTSEALRQKSGSAAPPPVLANMRPIPGARHQTCQWIEDDPRADARMCGRPTVSGLSWCAQCAERVFAPQDPAGADPPTSGQRK